MKKGCAAMLLVWVACVGFYAYLAWPIVREVMPTAIIAVLGGTFAAMLLGGVIGLFTGGNDRAALRRAGAGEPMKGGRLEAASGPIRPLGSPLEAPFSGRPCVAYEYDVKARGGGKSDFAGVALTPSAVDGTRGPAKLLGWAMLDEFPGTAKVDRERADAYLKSTTFEPLAVTRMLSIFSELTSDDDGAIRKDFRIGDADPTVEGKKTEEKIVAAGQVVTVLGIWDEARGGFTAGGRMSVNRIFPLDRDAAAKKLGGQPWKSFVTALFFFVALHAILVPMYFLGRYNRRREDAPPPTPSQAAEPAEPTAVPAPAVTPVTVENGRPLADDSPALAAVKEYLAAVNEGDLDAMARLVPGSSKKLLEERKDEDLDFWRSQRPRDVREAGGYENDEEATIRIEGPSQKGENRVVMYHLKKTFEGWRIYREWFPRDR